MYIYFIEKNERNMSIMKKGKNKKIKVFLGIVLAIVILVIGIVIWQWNNVVSVVYFLNYSESDLEHMDTENKQQLNDAMEKLQISEPRELTKEEIQALENGEITQEEAIQISLGKKTLEEIITKKTEENFSSQDGVENNNGKSDVKNEETGNPENKNLKNEDFEKANNSDTYLVFATNGDTEYEWRYNWKFNSRNYYLENGEEKTQTYVVLNTENKVTEQIFLNRNEHIQNENNNNQEPKTEESNSKLSGLIAELYVLKSSYISKLNGLEAKGKSEYSSTPPNERTSSWKANMISKYTGEVSAWEGECDAKVEAVISKIKAELKQTGGDMSVINTIRSTYEKEKQIKKAGYMNTYLN